MKKVICIFLAAMMLFLSACAAQTPLSTKKSDLSTTTQATQCAHIYSKVSTSATCLNGGIANYKCSRCGATVAQIELALGHTTSNGKCTRCGEIQGVWKIDFYVDEFNNSTDNAYLTNSKSFTGSFSNSVTTDSKLSAKVAVDTNGIYIFLWEYGSQTVKAYSDTAYSITFLDDSGTKHISEAVMPANYDRLCLVDWKLVNLLQDNNELQIYVKEQSKYGVNSTYLFTITNDNFNSLYSDYYYTYINPEVTIGSGANQIMPDELIGSTIILYNASTDRYVSPIIDSYITVKDTTKTTLQTTQNRNESVRLIVKEVGETIIFVTTDGEYLCCDSGGVYFDSKQTDYSRFILEEADNGYYIRCYSYYYNGKSPQYLDIYNNELSAYSIQTDILGQYVFQLQQVS